MAIGEIVKRLRERRAYSQEDLGKLAGVSANTIWRIEAEGRAPRPSTIRKLAEALKVDVGELTAPDPGYVHSLIPYYLETIFPEEERQRRGVAVKLLPNADATHPGQDWARYGLVLTVRGEQWTVKLDPLTGISNPARDMWTIYFKRPPWKVSVPGSQLTAKLSELIDVPGSRAAAGA